jgi:uncharacterized protein (TIGR00645 family)
MNPTIFARVLFASRWLLTPFYVALVVALLGLLGKGVKHAYELAIGFVTFSEDDIILSALGIVDLTLTASLIVLVIFSGFANFVARIDIDEHPDWPHWMIGIDFAELKLKLMGSIVAIAGIKLLESYMNINHTVDRDLGWQMGIFGAFVVATLLLSISEWVSHIGAAKDH